MKKGNIQKALISNALPVLGTGAGAAGAALLNNVDAFKNTVKDPMVRGLIKIGAGFAGILFLAKGKEADIIKGVCSGVIAVGALEAANSMIKDSNKKLRIEGVNGFINYPTAIGAPAQTYYNRPAPAPSFQENENDEDNAISGMSEDNDFE